jgi:hypothetical protein
MITTHIAAEVSAWQHECYGILLLAATMAKRMAAGLCYKRYNCCSVGSVVCGASLRQTQGRVGSRQACTLLSAVAQSAADDGRAVTFNMQKQLNATQQPHLLPRTSLLSPVNHWWATVHQRGKAALRDRRWGLLVAASIKCAPSCLLQQLQCA